MLGHAPDVASSQAPDHLETNTLALKAKDIFEMKVQGEIAEAVYTKATMVMDTSGEISQLRTISRVSGHF